MYRKHLVIMKETIFDGYIMKKFLHLKKKNHIIHLFPLF